MEGPLQANARLARMGRVVRCLEYETMSWIF